MSTVFPDPEGAAHPDRRGLPQSAQEMIDHAIRDIKFNFTWDFREDGAYCHVCAPGGYRIKQGSEPQMHEDQRNPDTHQQNLKWWTLQWFKVHKLPVPIWPDCYENRRGLLWCHVCRRYAGTWSEEDGRRHDGAHAAMTWKIMRANRLNKQAPRQRIKAHLLDEYLDSLKPGYDPEREAAAARGQFGDPEPDPNRPPAVEGAFVARPGSSWQDRLGYNFMGNEAPTSALYTIQDDDGNVRQVTAEYLDEWHEEPSSIGVIRWRNACNHGLHITAGVRRPCIGEGCECSCHRDADQQ